MRFFKHIVPVLALVLAVAASAFTTKTTHHSKSLQALEFYYIVNGVPGDHIGSYDPNNEEDLQALKDETGCNDVTGVCARGYTSPNPTASTPWQFTLKRTN